jgi:hypothetical protein
LHAVREKKIDSTKKKKKERQSYNALELRLDIVSINDSNGITARETSIQDRMSLG